jgi:parallel beta-helix repeat protein
MTRAGLGLRATTLVTMLATTGWAAEHFVDPGAADGGDGSEASPWNSLQGALDSGSVQDGDTVWLREGDHGDLSISGADNMVGITIAARAEEIATFSSVLLRNSSGWTLRGLTVIGESRGYLIDLDGDNENVSVEDCSLRSTEDTSGWSAQDWIDRASSGISVDGTQMTIRNNYLFNVGYGISVGADHSLVEGNVIENFSRDGLRGLGDYSVFQYNTVKNCFAVDDHHDDGFQSWSVGTDGEVGTGEVVGIVLRGNTIINYEDPNQPHRGTLQGIGCFDGTFVDWVVENNVVVTDHWHGISLYGARNCSVTNNTVLDQNAEDPGPPWISVDDHKDGTPPQGCVVRNNLTTDLANSDQVEEQGNITFSMDEAATYFVDVAAFDLHLRDDAPAIDAGTTEGAPDLDHDRIPRPQGDGVDVGAFEWHDGSAVPVAGGAGNATTTSGGTGTGGGSRAHGSGDEGGCGCGVPGSRPTQLGAWALLTLLAWRRRCISARSSRTLSAAG